MIKLLDLLEKKMTPAQKKKRGDIYDALVNSGMSPKKAGPIATAKAMGKGKKEALDPIGKEDDDINNDGKVNKTDKYLANRRKAIAQNINEGDHEVSMAQASLKAIAEAAMELSNKLGNIERNIPGWIQDHITNAENYIEQAAQGFHELKEGKQIATSYQFTPKQFELLKKYGTKISTSGNELFIPIDIKMELDKNKVNSKFKQEFYDTVPPSDDYIASALMMAIKKSLENKPTNKIGDKLYLVLNGHMTKNGNFNFPNPYRNK